MEKLDIFVRDDLTEVIQRLDQTFSFEPADNPIKLIAVGFALNYKNWFMAVPHGFTDGFKPTVAGIEGVYVNEYPPELLADMEEHG